MKRTILIPTDFTIESLKPFKEAIKSLEIGSVNVVFLHCVHLSDSIVELLFLSKKELTDSLLNADFLEACKVLQQRYAARVNSTRIELFMGGTQHGFDDFLAGNRIEEIYMLKDYVYKLASKRSFSPEPYLKKCKVPLVEVIWEPSAKVPEKNTLAEIFLL